MSSKYPDDGELTIDTEEGRISGWQSIRLSRGVERMPSDFDIGATEKFPTSTSLVPILPGDVCRVRIGGDLVLTGYIDRLIPSMTANTHDVRLLGRSACADLVDNMVAWRNGVINATNVRDVAEKLAGPYGVTVHALAGDGPSIPQLMINLGESPYAVIERCARYGAMLAYDDTEGNLVLSQVGTELHSSGAVQGANILEAAAEFSLDERFGEYHCYQQSVDSLADFQSAGGIDGNELAVITDPGMANFKRPDGQPRVRRMAIITEQVDQGTYFAEVRAKWEMARRFGRSQALRVTVDSWRDSAGLLWTPNRLVPLELPALKIKAGGQGVIGEVTYIRDARGTRATLVVMPPEAYQPEPVILAPFDAQIARALPGQVPPPGSPDFNPRRNEAPGGP